MAKLRLDLPPNFILVDTDKITPNKMEELSDALGEAKLKNSVYGKFPMQEGETDEEWEKRINPLYQAENGKKEEESVEDYLKRVFKPSLNKKQLLFDSLKAIATVFGQGDKVTMDCFGNASYAMMKSFVSDIHKTCDFPNRDFE